MIFVNSSQSIKEKVGKSKKGGKNKLLESKSSLNNTKKSWTQQKIG